jgi:hypothetical protein
MDGDLPVFDVLLDTKHSQQNGSNRRVRLIAA